MSKLQLSVNRYKIPSLMMGIWVFICIFMVVIGDKFKSQPANMGFMIWNLILAIVPLAFSAFIYHRCQLKGNELKLTGMLVLQISLWLLFFPNTIYLLTDFIHINTEAFIINLPKQQYNNNPHLWWNFITMMMFGFFGVFAAFLSLNMIHRIILTIYSKKIALIFVTLVSVLSAFGVYLGRFIRLNSWNLLTKPFEILEEIINSINILSISFTIFLSIFIFVVFTVLDSFTYIEKIKSNGI